VASTKNLPFRNRLGFAISGFVSALRSENSFKVHVAATIAVLAALIWLRPQALWWAIAILTIMAVLALELVNTAIEKLADHLHPENHPEIKIVKDCAAAAVLIASIGALAIAAALAYELLG
jgi:diacylglycerol kinase (ATP)